MRKLQSWKIQYSFQTLFNLVWIFLNIELLACWSVNLVSSLAFLQKIKELNLEEWKNIRGPRPWEDSREYQEQQRTRQDKKAWGPGMPGRADCAHCSRTDRTRVDREFVATLRWDPVTADAATSGHGLCPCCTLNFGHCLQQFVVSSGCNTFRTTSG